MLGQSPRGGSDPRSWVLAFDIGSSTFKATVFDRRGLPLLSVRRPIRTHAKRDRVELDAEAIWKSTQACLDEICASLGPRTAKIRSIGLTGQRSTVVLWDRGGAICPALSWQDTRAGAITRALSSEAEEIRRRTGLMLSPYYMAPKIRWALDHLTSVRQAYLKGTLKWGSLASYLIWKLTQGKTYALDHTHAQRTLLLNAQTLRWDSTLLAKFGLGKLSKPAVRAVSSNYGEVVHDRLQASIEVCLGDGQAALLAYGLGENLRTGIEYGSGAFVGHYLGHQFKLVPRLLTSILHTGAEGCLYYIEGTVNSAATFLGWLQDHPRLPHFDLPSFPQGLIPALRGLGAPHWDDQVRPSSFGRTRPRQPAKLGMAALGYRCREIVEWMSSREKRPIPELFVSGGLCHHEYFVRVQATILGRRLIRRSREDAALSGVALLLGKGRREEKKRRSSILVPPSPGTGSYLKPRDWQRAVYLARSSSRWKWFSKSLWMRKLSEGRPLVFAHRGASRTRPENTEPAFLQAAACGADGIEFDIRLTRDRVPVVIHDPTLDRTTNGTGEVRDCRFAQLPFVAVSGKMARLGQEIQVPSLEQAIRTIPKHLLLYLEIKDETSDPLVWKKTVEIVDRMRIRPRIVFTSFNHAMTLRLKKERPDLIVGGIFGSGTGPIKGMDSICPELDLLSVGTRVHDPQLIDLARAQGQMFMIWTVDRLPLAQRYVREDVDVLVTNRIEQINPTTVIP